VRKNLRFAMSSVKGSSEMDKQTGGKCRRHRRTAFKAKSKIMKTLTKLTLAVKRARHIKNAILALVLLTSVITASAQGYHYVRPYYNHNGTFVSGHYQTNPDGNIYNNWRTYPNINPFTGQQGTLHTMPRGYGSGSNGLDVNDGLDVD